MGWYHYYALLEKYGGDLSKVPKEEMDFAAAANPIDPQAALEMAREKYSRHLPRRRNH